MALYPAELRVHLISPSPTNLHRSTDSDTFNRASHPNAQRAVLLHALLRACSLLLSQIGLLGAYAKNFGDRAACRQALNLLKLADFFHFLPNRNPLTSAFGGQRSIQLSYWRLAPCVADCGNPGNLVFQGSLPCGLPLRGAALCMVGVCPYEGARARA